MTSGRHSLQIGLPLKSFFHRSKSERLATTERWDNISDHNAAASNNQTAPHPNEPDSELQSQPQVLRLAPASAPKAWQTNADIWEAAQSRVSSDQHWTAFNQHFRASAALSVDEILEAFIAVRELYEAQKWTVAIPVGDIKFKPRNVLSRIIEYAETFREIGGAIAALDLSKHAGLAWGALQFLVTLAVKNENVHDLIKNHEFVANIMCRTSIYAEISLNRAGLVSSTKILETVCRTYVSLLRYFMAAWHFLERNKVYHALSTLAPSNPVQEAFSKVVEYDQELITWQMIMGAEVAIGSCEVVVALQQKPEDLGSPMNRIVKEVELMQDKDRESSKKALLEWVSPIQHYDRFEEVRYNVLEGTGKWLLEDKVFKSWRRIGASRRLRSGDKHSVEYPSVLWLLGKMGSGKSTLVSLVVDELLEESQSNSDTMVAFFFCDKTSRNEQLVGPRSILRNLLKQWLLSMSDDIPAEIRQCYKSERRNGMINRRAHFFIKDIVASSFKTTIVIDGLDECDIETRTGLLDDLKWLQMRSRGRMKVLVASRLESDISQFFEEDYPGTTIPMRNDSDIELFVRKKVEEEFYLKRLSPCLKSDKDEIISILMRRSEGMFRWVQLSLKSLRTKGRPETAIKRLKGLPLELKELYEDIYREIRDIDPADFFIVQRTLLLIIYQRVPLGSTEVVEAVWEEQSENSGILQHRKQLLSDMCSDFIELDSNSGCFRLAHSSVRDFLESREDYAKGVGHREMAKMCVSAVSKWFRNANHFEGNGSRWDFEHFICYALTQWPAHVWQTLKLGAEDEDLAALLNINSNRCPDNETWRLWLSQVLAMSPGPSDDSASLFAATDKDSILSRGNYVSASPENMSSGSSQSGDSGGETTKSRPTSMRWEQLSRQHRPRQSPFSVFTRHFQVSQGSDLVEKKIRQLVKRCTSVPPNPLFAFSVWHILEFLCEPAHLPKSRDPFQLRNVLGETPVADFCTSFDPQALERILCDKRAVVFKSLVNRYPDFVSAAITRNFCPDEKTRLVQLLLEHGATFHRSSTIQPNALHSASDFNLPEVLELLLSHGAEIDATDYSHSTALDRACANGSVEAARVLLAKGASLKPNDSNRISSVLVAASHRQWDMVRLLAEERVDLNTRNHIGQTALELAIDDSNEEMVRFLLRRGADPCAVGSKDRPIFWSALLVPKRRPSLAIIKALLEHGADVLHFTDATYGTPLEFAATNLNEDVVDLLSPYYADSNLRNPFGKTALHLAVRAGNLRLIATLIKADVEIDAKDNSNHTALLELRHPFSKDIIRLLCMHGADPSARDSVYGTLLHRVTLHGCTQASRALIEAHADVNIKDKDGYTALHLASKAKPDFSYYTKNWLDENLSLINMLLANGAHINAIDNDGNTALFLAMETSRSFAWGWSGDPIVDFLLEKGADTSIKNLKGESASTHPRTQPKSIHVIGGKKYKFEPPRI